MSDASIDSWAAGFFDGEGCVLIGKSKRSDFYKGINYQLNVAVSQVDINPLNFLKKHYGGKVHTRKNTNQSQWRTTSKNALVFLNRIHQFSIVKKPEIAEALKYEETLTDKNKVSWSKMNETIFKKREEIYKKLKELKHLKYG